MPTEEAAAQRAELLRLLLGSLKDSVVVLDVDGRVREIFGSFEREGGWTREQLIGGCAFDLVHPEERAAVERKFAEHVRRTDAAILHFECRVMKRDGEYLRVEAAAESFVAHPLIRGVVLSLRDLAPRQDAERARLATELHHARRLFEAAAASVPSWIVLIDRNFRIQFCNLPIRGYTPEQLVGLSITDIVEPDEAERYVRHAHEAAERRCTVQYRNVVPGGARILELRLSPVIVDGEVVGFASSVTEDTQRLALERAVLEIASREQRRIGSDLHDGLGQELTGIALTLKSLLRRAEAEHDVLVPEITEVLAYVNGSIEAARRLARGLSPVSSIHGGLKRALEDLAARTSTAAGPRIECAIDSALPAEVEPMLADYIYRIAQEAVTNALRHANANAVRIALDVVEGAALRLRIDDDGGGIDPSAEVRPSGGLGLRIMRYRSETLGGRLDVRRLTGGGTRVECTCPTGAAANGADAS